MEFENYNRPAFASIVLKNIKNVQENRKTKPKAAPKKSIVNWEYRSLNAELGVERYKNILVREEIVQNTAELNHSNTYANKLKDLQSDYSLLQSSVQRSMKIQEQQKIEITELKQKIKLLKQSKY